jgi:hypothetical protein
MQLQFRKGDLLVSYRASGACCSCRGSNLAQMTSAYSPRPLPRTAKRPTSRRKHPDEAPGSLGACARCHRPAKRSTERYNFYHQPFEFHPAGLGRSRLGADRHNAWPPETATIIRANRSPCIIKNSHRTRVPPRFKPTFGLTISGSKSPPTFCPISALRSAIAVVFHDLPMSPLDFSDFDI